MKEIRCHAIEPQIIRRSMTGTKIHCSRPVSPRLCRACSALYTARRTSAYGIDDPTAHKGWVSVGTDHETARLAVETLRRWWERMGRKTYPKAQELLITAEGGGSTGSRNRWWKYALQGFANETGLTIPGCHFPPGTSKWNKIEQRMFGHITENWRGRPLVSLAVIVNLIANTTTTTGLKIQAELDPGVYPTGLKITDQQMKEMNLHPAAFHGKDWNYRIKPKQT